VNFDKIRLWSRRDRSTVPSSTQGEPNRHENILLFDLSDAYGLDRVNEFGTKTAVTVNDRT